MTIPRIPPVAEKPRPARAEVHTPTGWGRAAARPFRRFVPLLPWLRRRAGLVAGAAAALAAAAWTVQAVRAERAALLRDADGLLERHRLALTADLQRALAAEIARGMDQATAPETAGRGAVNGLRGLARAAESLLAPGPDAERSVREPGRAGGGDFLDGLLRTPRPDR